ncbi:GyrI-like domain-containing protein [Alkaliphilus pronyensis]
MERLTVEKSTYAVFTHKCSVERLGDTFKCIYGTWLPKLDMDQ